MMNFTAEIASIQHRFWFQAYTPQFRSFQKHPAGSRLVRDISEIPPDVHTLVFDTIVVIKIDPPQHGGKEHAWSPISQIVSEGINQCTFEIARSQAEAATLDAEGYVEIPVHPLLRDTVRIFAHERDAAEQNAETPAETVLTGDRHLESWGKPPVTTGMRMGSGGFFSI